MSSRPSVPDWDSALEQASAILSEPQMEVLKQLRDRDTRSRAMQSLAKTTPAAQQSITTSNTGKSK